MSAASRPSVLFIAALALGAAVRLAALPLPGTEDVGVWRIWSYHASLDVTTMYGVGGDPPVRPLLKLGKEYTVTDYPPVALFELGLAGIFYRGVFPGYPNDSRLTEAVKIPGLVAGACLAALLHAVVFGLTGSLRTARMAALAYWLNPATILNAEVLGYLDAELMLPLVGALVLAHKRRFGWAGAVMAVAAFTKPQAVLAAPAVLLALARLGGRAAVVRAALGSAGATLAILLPFALAGTLRNLVFALSSFGRTDILSGYAANVWWLVNWLERAWHLRPRLGFPGAYSVPVARVMALSTFIELGWPNPRPLAAAAVLSATGWAVWKLRRTTDLALHAALAAFTVLTYFTIAIGVHENHIVSALPFLLVAASRFRELRPLFVALSLSAALNMNLFYGLGHKVGWALPRTLTPIDASVLLSMVNIAALVWFARWLGRHANSNAGEPA
jgi:Gpi18-like mannosyltransferase